MIGAKTLARIGAAALVGVAATVAVIEAARPPAPAATPVVRAEPPARDKLRRTLELCSALGEQGGRDPVCLAAWVENRRRFLGQNGPADAAPAPDNASGPDAGDPAGLLR